jgi:hypothetical protein
MLLNLTHPVIEHRFSIEMDLRVLIHRIDVIGRQDLSTDGKIAADTSMAITEAAKVL